MAFSELFDTGFKSRNKGHFAAIVRVALSDGKISDKERLFLDKLAQRLEISELEYEEILKNPSNYPVNPPYLHINRIERLYDLGRMVRLDNDLGEKQPEVLTRFAVALGFTPSNVVYIVDKALKLIDGGVDLDTFIYEMQNMNR
ncbi:MAG: TerB family tellurite resistance protein [Bacteroidota bacterium]|nr:TerB family tellurite resistance protein [Bacteroidota bacterium]